MPAILRTGDWLGSGVQSSLTFSANEANFRKRSQRQNHSENNVWT